MIKISLDKQKQPPYISAAKKEVLININQFKDRSMFDRVVKIEHLYQGGQEDHSASH